jgi:AcrR family transcriptional regulator
MLGAARTLVMRDGAEPLTMRRLADHLGVAPNTLYSHYPNKAALMDAVLDSLLGDIEVPDLDRLDWRDGLVAVMDASRRMLLTHPDLLPLLFARPMRGPNVIRLGEQTLALLARGGIAGPEAVVALRAMLMLTFGWVAIDAPRRAEPDPAGRQAESYAAFAGQEGGPMMAALADPLSRPPAEPTFETSLRWLIDGIARGASSDPSS